jgi:hypothetical protein
MANIIIRLGQNPTIFDPEKFNVSAGATFTIEVHKSLTLLPPEIRALPEGVSEINRENTVPNVTIITLKVSADAHSGFLTIGAKREAGHTDLIDEKTSSGWIEVMQPTR